MPGYTPAHWVPIAKREFPLDDYDTPKSECCNDEIVYYDEHRKAFLVLPCIYETLPKRIIWRCRRCNQEIDRERRLATKHRS